MRTCHKRPTLDKSSRMKTRVCKVFLRPKTHRVLQACCAALLRAFADTRTHKTRNATAAQHRPSQQENNQRHKPGSRGEDVPRTHVLCRIASCRTPSYQTGSGNGQRQHKCFTLWSSGCSRAVCVCASRSSSSRSECVCRERAQAPGTGAERRVDDWSVVGTKSNLHLKSFHVRHCVSQSFANITCATFLVTVTLHPPVHCWFQNNLYISRTRPRFLPFQTESNWNARCQSRMMVFWEIVLGEPHVASERAENRKGKLATATDFTNCKE